MKFFFTTFIFLILIYVSSNSEWHRADVEVSPLDTPWDSLDGKNTTMNFSGIDCADPMNCLAIANDGAFYRVIYQSIDAGKTWKMIFKPDYGFTKKHTLLHSVSYPTKNKCVIGADSGVVYLTNDMGNTWSRINTPIYDYPDKYPVYRNIHSIQMYDSIYGIASTGFLIIYTKDGGNSWTYINKPDSSCGILDAVIISPSKILVYANCIVNKNCPYNRMMFISNDTGNTWTGYDYTNIDNDGNQWGTSTLMFTDSIHGWAVGGDPTGIGDTQTEKIAATTDGGKSWQMQYNQLVLPNFQLLDVSFHNKDSGLAVSLAGGIIRTTDGGVNWWQDSVAIIRYNDPPKMNTCYRNVKFPIIVDFCGRIFYEDDITSVMEQYVERNILSVYPNPISNSQNFNIRISLENSAYIKIELINNLGLKVSEILKGYKESGEHNFQYTSDFPLSSGTYWTTMTINGVERISVPFVILK
jgi:photosystem II stability/assembly factor-like uncharacterized protein